MHWTQRPENKQKVKEMALRAAKTRELGPSGRPKKKLGRPPKSKAARTVAAAVKSNGFIKSTRLPNPQVDLRGLIKHLQLRRDALTTTIETLKGVTRG
jgi:hypothetical protein